MVRVGGLTSKYYKETRGLKVSGGEFVNAGTVLTREGHRWQPGQNVIGQMHVIAKCDGEVYFTKTKNSYNKIVTIVNIRPKKEEKKK